MQEPREYGYDISLFHLLGTFWVDLYHTITWSQTRSRRINILDYFPCPSFTYRQIRMCNPQPFGLWVRKFPGIQMLNIVIKSQTKLSLHAAIMQFTSDILIFSFTWTMKMLRLILGMTMVP